MIVALLAGFALLVLVIWAVLLAFVLRRGVDVGRAAWATAALAVFVSMPLTPAFFEAAFGVDGFVAGRDGRWSPAMERDVWFCCFAALLLAVITIKSLSLPRQLRKYTTVLAADDSLRGRVEGIAQAAGAPMPELLVLRGSGAEFLSGAFAAGVVRPQLLLGDGVLVGMSPARRDAILAHELAHVANHDVLTRLGAAAVALTFVAAFADRAGIEFLVLVFLVIDFALVAVSQRQELACDRAAVRIVGARPTFEALDHIHAQNQQLDPFRGDVWWYATLTHPAGSVRAAAIARLAPQELSLPNAVIEHARACRRVRPIALALYAAVLLGVILVEEPRWLRLTLLALACLPILWRCLVLRSMGREGRQALALTAHSEPRDQQIRHGLFTFGLVLLVWGGLSASFVWYLVGGAFMIAAPLWRIRSRRLFGAVHQLVQRGESQAALARFEKSPSRARSPQLREIAARLRAAAGDVDRAIQELVCLRRDVPRQLSASLCAATLCARRDPDRAIELAAEVAASRPRSPLALGVLASVEFATGRLDDAARRVTGVRRAFPRVARWAALAARIALHRGEHEAADRHLAVAQRLGPGDPWTAIAMADFAIERGQSDATQSLRRAIEVHRALPLSLLGDECAHLEARAAARLAIPSDDGARSADRSPDSVPSLDA